jgi:hypothetical protein
MTNPNKPVEPTKGLRKQYNRSADVDLEEETTRILNKLESDYLERIRTEQKSIEAKLAAMHYPSELPECIKVNHKMYNLSEDSCFSQHKTTTILNKLISEELAGIWGILEENGAHDRPYWHSFIEACERAFFRKGFESSKQKEINDNKADIINTTNKLKRLITGVVQNDELKVAHLFPDNGLKLLEDSLSSSLDTTLNPDFMEKIDYASTSLSEGLDRLVELIKMQSSIGIARDKGRAHFNHFKKNMVEFFIKKNNNPLEEIVAKLATVILNDGITYTKDMVAGRE